MQMQPTLNLRLVDGRDALMIRWNVWLFGDPNDATTRFHIGESVADEIEIAQRILSSEKNASHHKASAPDVTNARLQLVNGNKVTVADWTAASFGNPSDPETRARIGNAIGDEIAKQMVPSSQSPGQAKATAR